MIDGHQKAKQSKRHRDATDGKYASAAAAPGVLKDQRKIAKHKPILRRTPPPWSGYSDEVADYSDESAESVDEEFMRAALDLASEAEAAGEVPVGAIVVIEGRIVGRGYNSPVSQQDPTAHAEVLAIRQAAKAVGNYRLMGSTLYVTLEPCPMCAGAMVHARVGRLVFGARDLRFGGIRSKFRLADSDLLNHRLEVVEGVCAADCVERLQRFFGGKRE